MGNNLDSFGFTLVLPVRLLIGLGPFLLEEKRTIPASSKFSPLVLPCNKILCYVRIVVNETLLTRKRKKER